MRRYLPSLLLALAAFAAAPSLAQLSCPGDPPLRIEKGSYRVRGHELTSEEFDAWLLNVRTACDWGATVDPFPQYLTPAEAGALYAPIGAAGGNSFETINASSGTDPVADSSTDTLNLTAGTGITVTGVASTDTVTIASTVVDTDTDDQTAAEVPITDAGTYYTGVNVEEMGQEIGASLALRLTEAAADARYALLSHEHAAADITSGVLAVGRGGTGLASAAAGAVLIGIDDDTWDVAFVPHCLDTAGQHLNFSSLATAFTCGTSAAPPSGSAGGDLAGTYPDPTVAANAVALGTDTTGGYAASATEGGSATSVAANSVALGTDTTGGYAASATEGGPATTATALAANGANCAASSFPLGVDASGAVESCSTSISGNAATATALAANGANCSAGSYPLGVDASGAVESCTAVSGGTPGGSDTQIQFNDSSAFGGDAGFTYNKTTDTATLVGGLNLAGSYGFVADTTNFGSTNTLRLSDQSTGFKNLSVNWLCLKGAGSPMCIKASTGFAFRNHDDTGFYALYAGDIQASKDASQSNRLFAVRISGSRVAMSNDATFGFTSSTDAEGTLDTTQTRGAAGVTTFGDAIRLTPRSSPPVTCGSANTEGVIYSDSDSKEICFCDGTSFVGLKAGGACT